MVVTKKKKNKKERKKKKKKKNNKKEKKKKNNNMVIIIHNNNNLKIKNLKVDYGCTYLLVQLYIYSTKIIVKMLNQVIVLTDIVEADKVKKCLVYLLLKMKIIFD